MHQSQDAQQKPAAQVRFEFPLAHFCSLAPGLPKESGTKWHTEQGDVNMQKKSNAAVTQAGRGEGTGGRAKNKEPLPPLSESLNLSRDLKKAAKNQQ